MSRSITQRLNAAPARSFEFAMIMACLFFADPTTTSCIYGLLISSLGLVLKLWASGYKRPKQSLDTSGPYGFVRHPKSLGTFLLILGLSIAGYSFYFTLFFLLASALIFWNRIRQEEQKRENSQNPSYNEYRAYVPRFFPATQPYRHSEEKAVPFSLRYSFLVRRNRELEGIFVFIIAYAAMFSLQAYEYHRSFQIAIIIISATLVCAGFLSHRARRTA